MLGLGVAGQLLGQPGLAHARLAEEQQQLAPGVADGVLDAVAQEAELGLATDQPGAVALRSVAGRCHGRVGAPGGHRVPRGPWPRSARAPRSARCGGWRRRWRARRARRPAGRWSAGGWRCSRRRPSPCSRRRLAARRRAPRRCSRRPACGCRRRARRRPARASPACAARRGRRARRRPRGRSGAPKRATMASPMILSTRPPNASMSATSRSKQPSTRFFTCSGIHRLGQRGVADQVREEDRHDATLVSPQPQVLPALGAEPCARRHVCTTAWAGHCAPNLPGAPSATSCQRTWR